ncbi:MAG TPA: hypothetical protein VFV54_05400, partial [Thermoanaerobaculia bacterium]|nr:hypothetical protein [Thermoanaerobaculia bacterium]
TGSDVRVVPPSPQPFSYVSFSPDGNYLFYIHREHESGSGYASLFQVPTLGGAPRKIIFDVDTSVSFSPDGARLVFGRGMLPEGKNALVIANADGSGERVLLKVPRYFSVRPPAWSPDGTKIAWPVVVLEGGFHTDLLIVDPSSGAARPHSGRWRWIESIAWLPDGSGIVVIAARTEQARNQIWIQPHPDGDARRVTNDLNDYADVSLTADGRTMLTRRLEQMNQLMIAEPSDEGGGSVLSAATADQTPMQLAVAATGAVAYSIEHENGVDIAILDAPGATPRVLTRDGKSAYPSISDDGKTIAFQSWRTGDIAHVYAMDADGTNLHQLTQGKGEIFPGLTPDGTEAFYMSVAGELWRAPVAGGEPRKVVDRVSSFAVDAKRLAYTHWTKGARSEGRLAIRSLDSAENEADVPFPRAGVLLRWSPSGLTFFAGGTTSQIARLSDDRTTAVPLTRFRSGVISSFDWTADGKLVMARGERRADVVLISGFR